MRPLPLSGVRIADFTWQIAGPTCNRYLGLMGAEVIRVESNRRPDPSRAGSSNSLINQSKKSVTLNLAHPKGTVLAKRLVALSDAVVENFAAGVIERLGLGYDELSQANPDIIMVSSAGLGHSGPDMKHVAYGTLVQCITGWSALQGYPDRLPQIGASWTDAMVGMLQVFLINAALHRRWEQGEGQYIDLSMAEAVTMMLPESLLDYSMNGRVQGRAANRHAGHAPHGNYPCRGDDQWIGITVTSDSQWEGLCRTIGRTELLEDARFSDAVARWRNQEALDGLLGATTKDHDSLELTKRLQDAGVPAGPCLAIDQLWANPHLRERGFFQSYPQQDGTMGEMPGMSWRFDGSADSNMTAPPQRGQHNAYVFEELLGLSRPEIEALVEEQVIY